MCSTPECTHEHIKPEPVCLFRLTDSTPVPRQFTMPADRLWPFAKWARSHSDEVISRFGAELATKQPYSYAPWIDWTSEQRVVFRSGSFGVLDYSIHYPHDHTSVTALNAAGINARGLYVLAELMTAVLRLRRQARGKPDELAKLPWVDAPVLYALRMMLGTLKVEIPVAKQKWRVLEAITYRDDAGVEHAIKPIPGHWLHISEQSKPGAVMWAYTENDQKSESDIQTPIKPGRYLARFYPNVPHDVVTKLANLINGSLDTPQVLFAKTADEIVDVYRKGPWSCMHYSADRFDTFGVGKGDVIKSAETVEKDEWGNPVGNYAHPASVYGSLPTGNWETNPKDMSDLQLAYWFEVDPNDSYNLRITARALVWPAKKFYGRVYGGTKNRSGNNNAVTGTDNTAIKDRFTRALEALGYTSPKGWNSLDGARIRKVVIDGDEDDGDLKLLLPYIDGDSHRFDIGRTHVVINNCNGDYSFEEDATCGVWSQEAEEGSESDHDYTCARCGEGCDETRTVYGWNAPRGRTYESSWCVYCRENYALYCEYTEEYWQDDLEEVVYDIRRTGTRPDGTAIIRHYTQNWNPRDAGQNAYRCEHLAMLVSDDIPSVEVSAGIDEVMQTWAKPCAEAVALRVWYLFGSERTAPSGAGEATNSYNLNPIYYRDKSVMSADVYLLWQVQQGEALDQLDDPDAYGVSNAMASLSSAPWCKIDAEGKPDPTYKGVVVVQPASAEPVSPEPVAHVA